MTNARLTELHLPKGMGGCAICGFLCAAGCCRCEHWQAETGVELCLAMTCSGHSVDECARPEGIPHFDLDIYGAEGFCWGFAGAFLDDLVAEHHAYTVAGREGYFTEHRINECDDLDHSRFRLDTTELAVPAVERIMAEVREARNIRMSSPETLGA